MTKLTKVDSENALFAGASYAYYTMSSTPSCYKELTVAEDGTFTLSEVKGTATTVSDATATITDSSKYGDYQIGLRGDSLSADALGTVYGVVLNTKEGSRYGLRHLENIWLRTNFAFSTGFTTTAHGNTLAADHYKAIMGQTINSITYYTSTGIKTVAVDLYVPIKTEHTLTVANAVDQNTANVTVVLPKGYSAKYEVLSGGKAVDGASCNGTTVTLPENAKVGVYTLKVTDENGKYASYSTTFEKQTAINPVAYNNDALSLVAAKNKTDEDVKAYVSAITEVTVGGTNYVPSGRGKNVVKVINANGGLNLNTAPFANLKAGSTYEVTVKATGYSNPLTFTVTIPQTIYAYASVPYDEYWKSEVVYLRDDANWDDSSTEADNDHYSYNGLTLSEYDKGAFDAVSRATARHGIHRGSFQQDMVFHTKEGKDLEIAYWNNANSLVLKDGSTATFNAIGELSSYDDPIATITVGRTTYHMTGSELRGIKYVPVAVSANEFAAFSKAYEVTMNGDTLTGGYTEGKLIGFTDLTAAVTANTNGLKPVTKETDGSFSFGARQTGSDSGLKSAGLKTVDGSKITVEAKKYAGSYGESLRVHITGDAYGDLGSRMQTVEWKYYGNTDPSTEGATAQYTYGTKFAADNWMHKVQGIQLGLTESERCNINELPNKGAGYWTATIYALGYHDFTVTVEVTADNLPKDPDAMSNEQKEQLTQLKNVAEELLKHKNETTGEFATVTEKQWSDLDDHYGEAVALLADTNATAAKADELLGELPVLIAPVKLAPVTETYEELFPVLNSDTYKDFWVERVAAKLGKTTADETVQWWANYLKNVCYGKIYGPDAENKYKNDMQNMQFDCEFINGTDKLDTITFTGNVISGVKDNQPVFSNTYEYAGEITVGTGGMSFTGDLYKATAENAGEFTYFVMRDDTPGTTQHIEFRYGDTIENLQGYITGKYAYWLAAGIPVGSTAEFVKTCIQLFIDEYIQLSIEKMELQDGNYVMSFTNVNENDLADYLNAITKITINGTECEANSGYTFHTGGYVKDAILFKESNFAENGKYTIVISAKGYEDLTYTYTKGNGGSTEPVEPTTKTVTGQATITQIGSNTVIGSYEAKVSVTIEDGKITEVKDNGTDSGNNNNWWNMAKGMFAKFVGKDKADVSAMKTDVDGDKTDAITGATISSNGIKNAVLNALNSND